VAALERVLGADYGFFRVTGRTSQLRLRSTVLAKLGRSERFALIPGATAEAIEMSGRSRVDGVVYTREEGGRQVARARYFILACGALERRLVSCCCLKVSNSREGSVMIQTASDAISAITSS